ncbi:DNA polymerase III subunit delta [bacterium]|nr:DNA polymerase III subunit delta [bacterium]
MADKQISYTQLEQRIRAHSFEKVYFCHGEEPYYIRKLRRLLRETVVDEGTAAFNVDHFSGESAEGSAIVNAASSFPMMADRRLVIVDDVQQLPASAKDLLSRYLDRALESTVLLLTAPKIDMRKSFYMHLKKTAFCFESRPLYDNQARAWLLEHFRENGIQLSRDGADFIISQTGTGLDSLENEASKVMTACWGRKTLNHADIAEIVGFSRGCTVWEYLDALALGRCPEACRVLERLLEEGMSAVFLITKIYQRMELLMRIGVLKGQGYNTSRISSTLRIPGFFADTYFRQASLFGQARIRRVFSLLLTSDLYLKTGYMEPVLLMTLLTYEIASIPANGVSVSALV